MKKLSTVFLLILILYANCYSDNSIIIKEIDGINIQNYPVQIARPFIKGEIMDFPQALINSQPVLTQADVKCRWEDGSVKHSVITFYLPILNAYDSIKVNFINQETGNNENFLQVDSMLSALYNFEAKMIFINGQDTIIVSAREILENNHIEYWLLGGISTSIILTDHSYSRQYDFGFNQTGGIDTINRSIRPIFHVTFYPLINKIKIRYIAEISNSEKIQDQTYSLILTSGNSAPEQKYSKEEFLHHGLSRWTKEYWLGGQLPKISINHNLPYLTRTKLVPNYDTTKAIPLSIIQNEYNNWLSTELDINGNGSLYKYMPGTGGRPDIGPYPSWVVRWLYSGDNRMEEQSLINANLAGGYPMCLRECDTTKYLNKERTVLGLGKIASITDRPTIFFNQGYYNFIYQTEEDRIDFVGNITDNGWVPDNAHQPDVYSIPYLLTGDYWYLEQLMFWASYGAANSNGAASVYSFGRGPTGSEGGLPHEIRGQAWAFRTRVNCASIIPGLYARKRIF